MRHFFSHTKSYADIDPAIRTDTLEKLGGAMPKHEDGSYRLVAMIAKPSGWHYRATFGLGDYGTFCEPELAAFVANYGRLYPLKSREEVWAELGIVDLNAETPAEE